MISIGDLTNLYTAFQSAHSVEEKKRREGELNDALERHIRNLFKDPLYPKRRRTFGIIRNRLPIFDAEPIILRRHLVRIGAHRVRGEGDDELWHLPLNSSSNWQSVFNKIVAPLIVLVMVIGGFVILKKNACGLFPNLPWMCEVGKTTKLPEKCYGFKTLEDCKTAEALLNQEKE